MSKLPFACKDCGADGEADVAKMSGVKMTCEYCGASVTPPRYDVQLEPPDPAFLPLVMGTVQKLLGVGLGDALKICKETRVLGTGVSAEVADRQRTAIEAIGAKVTIIPR